jgi:diadenosine tetraphosphate (Ap4A) HIT family hydrolase
MMGERVAPIAATLIHWEGETEKAQMSDIEEEAYSEVCEEVKRLQERLGAALDSRRSWINSTRSARQEIERLKVLLARAADALEAASPLVSAEEETYKLIAELRKAAG